MTLDQFKAAFNELARPYAIYTMATAAAASTVKIAWEVTDGNAGAVFIAAVLSGLAALYGVRGWEKVKAGGHAAEVEKIRATANPPPDHALEPATADDGELPPDKRVRL